MVFLINQVPGAATAGCEKAGNGELWGRAERGLIAVHALILEPRLIDYFCAQHLRVADLQIMFGAVEVVGQRRPAGPDPLALVALQAAALESVASLEVADAALGAGAVALLAALGASRPGLLAAGDEDPFGCQGRQRLAGRAGVEAAVERDLARTQAERVQLGDRLGVAVRPRSGCPARWSPAG